MRQCHVDLISRLFYHPSMSKKKKEPNCLLNSHPLSSGIYKLISMILCSFQTLTVPLLSHTLGLVGSRLVKGFKTTTYYLQSCAN